MKHTFKYSDTFNFFAIWPVNRYTIIQIGSGEPFGNELADEEDRERQHGGGGGEDEEDEEEEWGEWEDEGDWEASVGSDSRYMGEVYTYIHLLEYPIPPRPLSATFFRVQWILGTESRIIDPLVAKQLGKKIWRKKNI